MSDLTMPALFTVLVGEDPQRRVATRQQDESGRAESWWDWFNGKEWRPTHDDHIHDPVEVIPDGTPVDRIVVLQPGEVVVDDLTLELAHSALERAAEDDEDRAAAATLDRLLSPEMYATLAARAAEPTPDPLEDARDAAIEALMNADDATKLRAVVRALLAATEGDR
jgi:hypothetical protein